MNKYFILSILIVSIILSGCVTEQMIPISQPVDATDYVAEQPATTVTPQPVQPVQPQKPATTDIPTPLPKPQKLEPEVKLPKIYTAACVDECLRVSDATLGFCEKYCRDLEMVTTGQVPHIYCPSGSVGLCGYGTTCDKGLKNSMGCCFSECIPKEPEYDITCYNTCMSGAKATETYCSLICSIVTEKTMKELICPSQAERCAFDEYCLNYDMTDNGCCYSQCLKGEPRVEQRCYANCMRTDGATNTACASQCLIPGYVTPILKGEHCPIGSERCENRNMVCATLEMNPAGCCFSECVPKTAPIRDAEYDACYETCMMRPSPSVSSCESICMGVARASREMFYQCPTDARVCLGNTECANHAIVGEMCCLSECIPKDKDVDPTCYNNCMSKSNATQTSCIAECAKVYATEYEINCPSGFEKCGAGEICLGQTSVTDDMCCFTECVKVENQYEPGCFEKCMQDDGATYTSCKANCIHFYS